MKADNKEKKDNIAKLKCYRIGHDWTQEETVEINLDDYVFFAGEWRLGRWHLVGHYCEKENYVWHTKELSAHGIESRREFAKFIAQANSYTKFQDCKVSRFNSMHYEGSFYGELTALFKMVEEIKAQEVTQENQEDDLFVVADT